jgi:hypothetical protein
VDQKWEVGRRNFVKINVYFSNFDTLNVAEEAKNSVRPYIHTYWLLLTADFTDSCFRHSRSRVAWAVQ